MGGKKRKGYLQEADGPYNMVSDDKNESTSLEVNLNAESYFDEAKRLSKLAKKANNDLDEKRIANESLQNRIEELYKKLAKVDEERTANFLDSRNL